MYVSLNVWEYTRVVVGQTEAASLQQCTCLKHPQHLAVPGHKEHHHTRVRLSTVVEGNLKAPFSIATTQREGATPFTGLLHFTLDTYLIMLSAKQGGIKDHFLSLWYDSTWTTSQFNWSYFRWHFSFLQAQRDHQLLETIKRAIRIELRDITEDSFQRCREASQRRIGKCIRLKGDYFKWEVIFVV